MSPLRKLIVNADDLGRTRGINDGVFEAHEHGIVTSATLMVGFDAARSAAQRLADHPRLGVGLHLVFTGARPLLASSAIPSLVDGHGRFARHPDALGVPSRTDVMREARAQLARFTELVGRSPTHLDTHHHSHRVPVILDAVIELASELGVPVRAASDPVRRRLVEAGIGTTDVFIEEFFGARANADSLLAIVGAFGDLPPTARTIELMCHPGRVDDELVRSSTYSREREHEIDALTEPRVSGLIGALDLRLVDFDSL